MSDSVQGPAPREFESQLEALIERGEYGAVYRLIEQLQDSERPYLLSRLGNDVLRQLLSGPDGAAAAEILQRLPDAQASGLLAELPAATAARVLNRLPSNEQAFLVRELADDAGMAILDQMTDPAMVGRLMVLKQYGDEEAGGIMETEFVSVFSDQSVDSVIRQLRDNVDTYGDYDVQYVYVTDRDHRLAGVLRLRDLILARPNEQVRALMIRDPLAVDGRTSLNDLHDIFLEHAFLGIPVVQDSGALIGVVRRAAVEEALADRIADDFRKTQGIIREELRSMPLLTRSSRRLVWLVLNIGLNIVAASVIALYEDTLARVIALAMFLPIISDMGGSSGNQAVAVTMRELSLGVLNPAEFWRVLRKEFGVGLLNGVVLGAVLGCVAWLWQSNVWLGGVIAAAMLINSIVAVGVGGCLPLLMKRFGFDPALASGPVLTTVTDMCGFFLVLSFASLVISQLA